MPLLKEDGSLTLTKAEVERLRVEVYKYGNECANEGQQASRDRMLSIRCMLPQPKREGD